MVLAILILATAVFVAGEFAFIAVDRNLIKQLADEGDRRASGVLSGLKNLSFQLSGAQLGITAISIVLGIIAEPTLGRFIAPVIDWLPLGATTRTGIVVVLALAVATILQMVIGEHAAKNYALARPLQTALRAGNWLRNINAVLRPIIVLFNGTANWIVRRIGIEPSEELSRVASLEEYEVLFRASAPADAVASEESELVINTISFGEKTAVEALVPRPEVKAIDRDATISDLVRLAIETGHSRFPVSAAGDLDTIEGVVHIKDAYRFDAQTRQITPVSRCMKPAYVVPETLSLGAILVEMRRIGTHFAVVVDEHGGTAGIITLEDIIEEIVGEIADEHDVEALHTTASIAPGVWRVDGSIHRDELKALSGFEFPDGEWETLAGFLLYLLQRVPKPGAELNYRDWQFKVEALAGKRIARVLITAPPDQQAVSGQTQEGRLS